MSLATLGLQLVEQRDETQLARRQLAELQELIALWFNESNCAARDWLCESARQYRERQARQRFEIQQARIDIHVDGDSRS